MFIFLNFSWWNFKNIFKFKIRYTVNVINAQQLLTSITLSCSAESVGVTGIDKQYQTSFATGNTYKIKI